MATTMAFSKSPASSSVSGRRMQGAARNRRTQAALELAASVSQQVHLEDEQTASSTKTSLLPSCDGASAHTPAAKGPIGARLRDVIDAMRFRLLQRGDDRGDYERLSTELSPLNSCVHGDNARQVRSLGHLATVMEHLDEEKYTIDSDVGDDLVTASNAEPSPQHSLSGPSPGAHGVLDDNGDDNVPRRRAPPIPPRPRGVHLAVEQLRLLARNGPAVSERADHVEAQLVPNDRTVAYRVGVETPVWPYRIPPQAHHYLTPGDYSYGNPNACDEEQKFVCPGDEELEFACFAAAAATDTRIWSSSDPFDHGFFPFLMYGVAPAHTIVWRGPGIEAAIRMFDYPQHITWIVTDTDLVENIERYNVVANQRYLRYPITVFDLTLGNIPRRAVSVSAVRATAYIEYLEADLVAVFLGRMPDSTTLSMMNSRVNAKMRITPPGAFVAAQKVAIRAVSGAYKKLTHYIAELHDACVDTRRARLKTISSHKNNDKPGYVDRFVLAVDEVARTLKLGQDLVIDRKITEPDHELYKVIEERPLNAANFLPQGAVFNNGGNGRAMKHGLERHFGGCHEAWAVCCAANVVPDECKEAHVKLVELPGAVTPVCQDRVAAVAIAQQIYVCDESRNIERILPIAPLTCIHNEKVAVLTRCAAPAPQPTVNCDGIVDALFNEAELRGCLEWTEFTKTVAKYDTNKLRTHVEGAVDMIATGKCEYGLAAHVKYEFLLKDGPIKPRLIQAHDQSYNCLLQPYMQTLTHFVSRYWNNHAVNYKGAVYRIMYASGKSQATIGGFYDQAVRNGAQFAIENDATNYDSSQTMWHEDLRSKAYLACGVPKAVVKMVRMGSVSQIKGKYHRWQTAWQMHSGRLDTSVGNSILMTIQTLHVLSTVCPGVDAYVMVLGDDMLALLSGTCEPFVSNVEAAYRSVGVRPKSKIVRPTQSTFLSSHFVPTADGTVLTPMLPRLTKSMLVDVSLLPKDNARRLSIIRSYNKGTALGLRDKVCHSKMHMAYLTAPLNASCRSLQTSTFMRWLSNTPGATTAMPNAATDAWYMAHYGFDLKQYNYVIDAIAAQQLPNVFWLRMAAIDGLIEDDTLTGVLPEATPEQIASSCPSAQDTVAAEEQYKRINPTCAMALVASEYTEYTDEACRKLLLSRNLTRQDVLNELVAISDKRLQVAVQHMGWNTMPLDAAVASHAAYNSTCGNGGEEMYKTSWLDNYNARNCNGVSLDDDYCGGRLRLATRGGARSRFVGQKTLQALDSKISKLTSIVGNTINRAAKKGQRAIGLGPSHARRKRKGGARMARAVGVSGGSIVGPAPISRSSNPAPMIAASGNNFRVRHCEYIGDVSSSTTTFAVTSFPLNPGMNLTFPWLANIAQNYDRYKWRKLRFFFRSLSATALNSTNTALGAIVMATQFDVYDPTFTNKQQMEIVAGAVSAAPDTSMMHVVDLEKKSTLPQMFIRAGAVPTGADQRLYDVGTFSVATVGSQAVAVIGELWVEYEVDFMQPRLPFGNEAALGYIHIGCQPTTAGYVPVGYIAAESNEFNVSTGTTYVSLVFVPQGYTIFVYTSAVAATTLTISGNMSVSGNVTTTNLLATNTGYNTSAARNSVVNPTYMAMLSTTVANNTGSGVTINFPTPSVVTGACYADIFIYVIPVIALATPRRGPSCVTRPVQVRTLTDESDDDECPVGFKQARVIPQHVTRRRQLLLCDQPTDTAANCALSVETLSINSEPY